MLKPEKKPSTKTAKLFLEMLAENKAVFDEFEKIHTKFAKNPAKNRAEFNRQGEEINIILKKYEGILCGKSEGYGYSNFSPALADGFKALVREKFSEIDEIGML